KGYDVFTAVLDEVRRRGIAVQELVLAEPHQPRTRVAVKFAAADVLLLTSRKGTESGPVVVKEAALTGLPVVSVDVGDVPDVLDGITPSTVVKWPEPWGSPSATDELVQSLADGVAAVLATRDRSNGPEHRDRIDVHGSAVKVTEVYERVLAR